MKKIILFFSTFFCASCAKREEVRYYPTGEIAYRAPLNEKGAFDKDVLYFYKNGKIQSIVPFKNGHINGIVKRFYPNGVLESTELRKDGELAGALKKYYPNALIKYEAKKYGNRLQDTAWYYRPNGKAAQLIVYDDRGRKIDFFVWNRQDKFDHAYTKPIFLSDKDTIVQGANYSFEVQLANRRSNNVTIKPTSGDLRIDSTKGKYAPIQFIVKHPTPGTHSLTINIYENWARKGSDTIWTNDYQIKHSFLVRRLAFSNKHSL